MRWEARNRVRRNLICIVVCLLTIVFTASAQDLSDLSSEYTITTFEGPKGMRSGIAGDAPVFLIKNELIRMTSDGAQLAPVPIDEINARLWILADGLPSLRRMLWRGRRSFGMSTYGFRLGRTQRSVITLPKLTPRPIT